MTNPPSSLREFPGKSVAIKDAIEWLKDQGYCGPELCWDPEHRQALLRVKDDAGRTRHFSFSSLAIMVLDNA